MGKWLDVNDRYAPMKEVLEYKGERYVFTFYCGSCDRESENRRTCTHCGKPMNGDKGYAKLDIQKNR